MKQLLDDTAQAVQRIYREAIDPVGDKFSFEKRPTEGEIAGAPTVLILGNHSSGKSTFINHLLGAEVQKTGLAPTDDSFTILAHGANEEEREGQAVVSNPDLPYAGLRHFGSEFLSHFRFKIRPSDILKNLTLIDTPGMIDAAKEESGRGYDFAGAVRWFAERADVVLVFFDPEKPGTTGETLQVFMQSLRGIDHKLLIVMNKMDRFQSLQDFARAYGALCWNLAKVIPRKDLPHIYTTFVPVPNAPPNLLPTEDFVKAREELIGEIRRAPARRVDNMLTQAHDHAERLAMHARVIDEARRTLGAIRLKLWTTEVLLVLVFLLAGGLLLASGRSWLYGAIFIAAAPLLGWGGFLFLRMALKNLEKQTVAGLPSLFEQLYARELLVRDRAEDLRLLWERVHPRTRHTLETLGMSSFRRLRALERDRLDRVLQKEIPELRSKLHRELGLGAPAEQEASAT